MFVPRWLVQALLAVGAVCVGWIGKDALGSIESSEAQPTAPEDVAGDQRDELVDTLAALASGSDDPSPSAPVELTIVVGQGGEPVAVAGSPPTSRATSADSSGVGHVGGSARDHSGRNRSTASATSPRRARGMSERAAPTPTRRESATHTLRSSTLFRAWGFPRPAVATAAPPRPDVGADRSSRAGGMQLGVTSEVATTAIGEHIVIAHDDSIVLVGDYGRLTGNTGDAAAGGVVALDAADSSFSTTGEPVSPGLGPHAGPVTLTTTSDPTAAGRVIVAADGTVAAVPAGGGSSVSAATAGVVSPLVSPIVSFADGRAVDIAGYEDHSLSVRGSRDIVTYDDSNVFIDRDGKINANTGDTDSAGLNAVDTVGSNVSAGPHCDDGCDDESIIQAEAGVFDEGDVAIDGAGNVVWAPDADGVTGADEGDDSLPGDDGDDEDAEDDESDDGDVSDPVEPAETREEADSTREAAGSGVDPAVNPPGDSLVIGGDGYDDLGIRVDGDDHVVTYDDSNVVVGGSGDVNAQIGDSDTGGTVTMGTVDSEVQGGNSR